MSRKTMPGFGKSGTAAMWAAVREATSLAASAGVEPAKLLEVMQTADDSVKPTLHLELLLADSHGFVTEENRRLQVLRERRVDGIIVIPSDRRASATALRSLNDEIVVAQVDRSTAKPLADFVGVDNEVGMRLIVEHLHACGVRTLAYAGADDASSNGIERLANIQQLSAENSIEITGMFRSEYSVAAGAAAAESFINDGVLPDAIVAASDQIAAGVIARLRQHGLEVPRDTLVTGFDGGELAEILWPSLTTVVQPVSAIAADAVSFLLARMEGESGALRRNLLAPTLQIGLSTTR